MGIRGVREGKILQKFRKLLHSRDVRADFPKKFAELKKIFFFYPRGVREILSKKFLGKFCIFQVIGKISQINSKN